MSPFTKVQNGLQSPHPALANLQLLWRLLFFFSLLSVGLTQRMALSTPNQLSAWSNPKSLVLH
jgi:hypothetical protein